MPYGKARHWLKEKKNLQIYKHISYLLLQDVGDPLHNPLLSQVRISEPLIS